MRLGGIDGGMDATLALAAEANGWESRYREFFDSFLNGYLEALVDPQIVAAKPSVAVRLALGFEHDREKYFEWIGAISEPIPEAEEEHLLDAFELYVDDVRARRPELDLSYFEVQRVGSLKL